MTDSDSSLLEKVEAALKGEVRRETLLRVLDLLLAHFNCATGTIHLLEEKSGLLELATQRGIPEVVLDKIKMIPVGKGMAGVAAERREPVQVCNLQTDSSGVVRAGARDTKMEGSLAAPMLNGEGALKGALGVAKPTSYDFSEHECELLMKAGTLIADRV